MKSRIQILFRTDDKSRVRERDNYSRGLLPYNTYTLACVMYSVNTHVQSMCECTVDVQTRTSGESALFSLPKRL